VEQHPKPQFLQSPLILQIKNTRA